MSDRRPLGAAVEISRGYIVGFRPGARQCGEDARVSDDRVLLDRDDETGIARITLNNPERRNSYDPAMREQIGAYLDELALDDDIKVVVLRGEGGVFSTGADMGNAYSWYEQRRPRRGNGDARRRVARASAGACSVDRKTFAFYHDFLGYPKATVAEVEGYRARRRLRARADGRHLGGRPRHAGRDARDPVPRAGARLAAHVLLPARSRSWRAACCSPATRSARPSSSTCGAFTEIVDDDDSRRARELVGAQGRQDAGRRHRDGEGGVPPRRADAGLPGRGGRSATWSTRSARTCSSTRASSTS